MNSILVIGPSWVGDMVMAQTLFKTLKQQDPQCKIDVLAPAWSLPILERMPEVNTGIAMPLGHGDLKLIKRFKIGRLLKGQYDQAIVLPNSLKSALIPFFAGIPKRTGWRGEMRYGLLNDLRTLNQKALPLMVQRFAALALPANTKALPVNTKALPANSERPKKLPQPKLFSSNETVASVQKKFGLKSEKKTLVLCPGAEFGVAKKWPEQHYAAVANQKISEGWQVWILGSKNDQQTTEKIFSLIEKNKQKDCINLSGRTDLVQTIDIISLANAVISNDSGLMHIAAAVGTPLVVVYGSTSPDFTPPLSKQTRILRSDIACAPCFKRTCQYKHYKCLVDQTPDTILSNFEALIASA